MTMGANERTAVSDSGNERSAMNDANNEPPPLLGTWRNLYIFVLVYLAVVILLFWLFTRHYAPVA